MFELFPGSSGESVEGFKQETNIIILNFRDITLLREWLVKSLTEDRETTNYS